MQIKLIFTTLCVALASCHVAMATGAGASSSGAASRPELDSVSADFLEFSFRNRRHVGDTPLVRQMLEQKSDEDLKLLMDMIEEEAEAKVKYDDQSDKEFDILRNSLLTHTASKLGVNAQDFRIAVLREMLLRGFPLREVWLKHGHRAKLLDYFESLDEHHFEKWVKDHLSGHFGFHKKRHQPWGLATHLSVYRAWQLNREDLMSKLRESMKDYMKRKQDTAARADDYVRQALQSSRR